MPRMDKIGTHCTTVAKIDGWITCTYHSTAVVRYNPITQEVILDSGGYETVTTKTRMNQFANQYGLDFGVYQKDWVWYVVLGTGPWQDRRHIEFKDKMTVNYLEY